MDNGDQPTGAPRSPVGAGAAGSRPWLGALEGYYGPPLATDERVALVAFLATKGYDAYAYGPKNDPYHRDRWREPYPEAMQAELRALREACAAHGLELGMSMAPGLDWRFDDPSEIDALAAKLETFVALGADALAVVWDDVPGEGEAIGRAHGAAVAAAMARVDAPHVRWITCPVDYALSEPTAYLEAFAAEVPESVDIAWTGPAIVSPWVEGHHADVLSAALGRRLLFGENFPVNDGGMAQVLHLGPYPRRGPDLVAASSGMLVNFMHLPRASRLGLAVAGRFWRDPTADRSAVWEEELAAFEGLAPLAWACRSWLGDAGPHPRLEEWADLAVAGTTAPLRSFLEAGCRAGLDPMLAAEVEPWLAQWDLEAQAMLAALHLLELDQRPTMDEVGAVALHWYVARRGEPQVFGIRFAYYPVSRRDGDRLVSDPMSVVHGDNLTDRLCTAALARWA